MGRAGESEWAPHAVDRPPADDSQRSDIWGLRRGWGCGGVGGVREGLLESQVSGHVHVWSNTRIGSRLSLQGSSRGHDSRLVHPGCARRQLADFQN